jgi:hypothetical protein
MEAFWLQNGAKVVIVLIVLFVVGTIIAMIFEKKTHFIGKVITVDLTPSDRLDMTAPNTFTIYAFGKEEFQCINGVEKTLSSKIHPVGKNLGAMRHRTHIAWFSIEPNPDFTDSWVVTKPVTIILVCPDGDMEVFIHSRDEPSMFQTDE